ncbi:MAG: glycosyltransferase family 4 protein [Gaiellaceae bacterium]
MSDRTVLVVSQRPLDLGGGGSARWRHLKRALAARGWRVVECSGHIGLTTDESSTDPRRARLAAGRAQVMAVAGRILDPAARLVRVKPVALAPNNTWALAGRRAVRQAIERERPDVVVATSPPVSGLFAAAAVVGDVPFVADVRDLWAGNPYYDRGNRVLASLQGRALARADAVVTVTEGCRSNLLALHPVLGERLHVLPNGYDPVLLERRRPPEAHDGPARLVYAGALYGEHNAVGLVEALERLRGRARLEIVGVVDPLTRRAVARGQADVELRPPVSWEEAIERVLGSDIAVVITTRSAGGDMALPNKLFEALAVGRPVLGLVGKDGDTARLLRRLGHDAGLAEPDDPSAISAAIQRLLADPPPPVPPEALADYDRDGIAERYSVLLDEVATRSSSETSSGTTTSRR